MSQTPELRHPVRGLVRGTFWPLSRAAPRAHWPRRGRYLDTIVRARGAKQARAAAKPFYALRRARDPLVELVETYPRPRRGRRHVRVVQKHLIR